MSFHQNHAKKNTCFVYSFARVKKYIENFARVKKYIKSFARVKKYIE
jgi:hypothetical protein